MNKEEAIKLATVALQDLTQGHSLDGKALGLKAIAAITEALAQPAPPNPREIIYKIDKLENNLREALLDLRNVKSAIRVMYVDQVTNSEDK